MFNMHTNRCYEPTSSPVTQNISYSESLIFRKPYLQYAEQQVFVCGRHTFWWNTIITFPGKCSTWRSSTVIFRLWGANQKFEYKIRYKTFFSYKNTRGKLEKWPHLWGGLRINGFMLRSWRLIFFKDFMRVFSLDFFVASAVLGDVGGGGLLLPSL